MGHAREEIGRSYEELAARVRAEGAYAGARAAPAGAVAPAGYEELLRGRVAEAAGAIEARVVDTVEARVRAAERRLQLQTEAIEAALGEGLAREVAERSAGLEREIVALRSRLTEAGRVAAERAASASASAEREAARLRAELEEARGEISRRSIRRERKRMREEGDTQAARLKELAEATRVEVADGLRREAEDASGRVEAALADGLSAALDRLRGEEAEARARLDEDVSRLSGERVAEALEHDLEGVLTRVEEAGERIAEQGVRRVEAEAEIAVGRLAAADRAQEREEVVRRRIAAAEAEAAERVRAAERRLVEVLDRVARVEPGPQA